MMPSKILATSFFARDQRAFKLVPKSIKEEERKGEGERGRERERKEKEHGKRKIRIGGKNIERRIYSVRTGWLSAAAVVAVSSIESAGRKSLMVISFR